MQSNENFSSSLAMYFDDFAARGAVARESAKLDFKTFHQRHAALASALPWLHWGLFSVFSVASACFFLYAKVSAMVPWPSVSLGLSVILLAVWEYAKSYLLSSVFRAWYYGLSHRGRGAVNPAAAGGAALLLAGSVFMSLAGAREAALSLADVRPQVEASALASRDSIGRAYGAKIAAAESSIAALEANKKHRWAGLLSASENRQILNLQARIAAFEAEESRALAQVSVRADEAVSAGGARAASVSVAMVAVSSVNEFAIVLCAWFAWYFAYRVRSERGALEAVSGSPSSGYVEHLLRVFASSGVQIAGVPIPPAAPAPPGECSAAPPVQPAVPVAEPEPKKACAHCGSAIFAKHWAAKYCGDACRIAAWEGRTMRRLVKHKKS